MRKKLLFICLSWLIALTANAVNLNLYLRTDGLTADPNSSTPYATTDKSIEEGTVVTIYYSGVDFTYTVLSIYINGEVVSSGGIMDMSYSPYTFTAKKNCILRVEGAYAFNFATNPNVYFTQDVDVTGVTLAPTTATLTVGETETVTLIPTVLPNDATDKSVTWSSSDEAVATVADGVVTAVAAGEATITVTTTDGAKTATCAVTVAAPAPSTYTVTLKEGTDDATSWTIAPAEATTTGVAAGTEVKATYNGTKKVKSVKAVKKAAKPAAKAAAEATAEDKGKLIGTDGKIYADVAAATAAGTTAVAKIIYIGTTGHATYSHGLALALTDEANTMAWQAAIDACSAKNTNTPVTGATWLLASKDQWNYMLGTSGAGSYTALRDGFSDITGASNLQSEGYWSSTERNANEAWYYYFYYGDWEFGGKDYDFIYVRACLAF